MKNKINIAELLRNCPNGMELDCTMFDNLVFCEIDSEAQDYPIITQLPNGVQKWFTSDGRYELNPNAKCVIFPKGKTTWEGFQKPFKDGDIIYTSTDGLECGIKTVFISIFKECNDGKYIVYASYCIDSNSFYSYHTTNAYFCDVDDIIEQRLATDEEKQKLFDAIKDNGYKWNEETKTLEKLPKFKVGDRVRLKLKPNYVYTIHSLAWDDNKKLAYRLLPNNDKHLILVSLNAQDDYESAPNKFDITTLKPFDKVLVRDSDKKYWGINLFGFYNEITKQFHCMGNSNIGWNECIPYEVNQHLLGTTDDCDEYFKTW